MRVAVTDYAGRITGYARNVIDLAGTGPDPDAPPEPRIVSMPQWPGLIVHSEWPHDGDVMLDGSHVYTPDEPVDLRCGHCVPVPEIKLDYPARLIFFVLHHERGCPHAADLAQLCRSAS